MNLSDSRKKLETKIANAVRIFDQEHEAITHRVIIESQDALNDIPMRLTINTYEINYREKKEGGQ